MKISWGVRISLLYTLFIAGIISAVVYFILQRVDLVTEHYYDEGIEYQAEINKFRNAKELQEPLSFFITGTKAMLKYPRLGKPYEISGELFFYRPSDVRYDRRFPVKPDSSFTQYLDLSNLQRGLWKLKANWNVNNTGYSIEQEFYLQ